MLPAGSWPTSQVREVGHPRPKTINVAYDGGGGCDHIPDELEKVKDGNGL
jgi:hypothetical protein